MNKAIYICGIVHIIIAALEAQNAKLIAALEELVNADIPRKLNEPLGTRLARRQKAFDEARAVLAKVTK